MNSLYASLISYWPLHEASGARADVTGQGNNLTDNNTVTGNPGLVENASQFTVANSEYLSIASNAGLQGGPIDYTLMASVYLDSTATEGAIVAKDNDAAGTREYGLEFVNTVGFSFYVFKATDSKVAVDSSLGVPSTSTWYNLFAWLDSVSQTIYIEQNGTITSAAVGGACQAASTAEFDIGRRQYTGSNIYFGGRICEVAKWNRVLTQQERWWLRNNDLGRTYPFDGRISPRMLGRRKMPRRNRRTGVIV